MNSLPSFAYQIRVGLVAAIVGLLPSFAHAGFPDPPKLASLSLESGSGLVGFAALSLSPAFDPVANHLSYSATIPFEHDDVNLVTASAANPFHVVEIPSPPSYPAGATTALSIVVVDDPFLPFETTTYTINITREESNDKAALLSLVSLEASLTPTFDSLTFQYDALVGFDTTNVSLTPTALQAGSTIEINGTPVGDGSSSAPIPLALGDNQVVVLITSADLAVTKGYEITFTRLEKDSDDDGMEDGWELDNNLLIGVDDSLLDKDGDGLLNIFEFAFGSNPCDQADAAHPLIGIDGAGFATISFFKAVSDNTIFYSPEISNPSESWNNDLIDQTDAGTPQDQVWRDNFGGASSPPPARWLRVRITPNF